MKLQRIYTKRQYEHLSYWDLVYEWEDVLAKELNIPIFNELSLFDRRFKGIPGLYSFVTKGVPSLCFQMGAEIFPAKYRRLQELFGLRAKNISNVVPVIIDWWQLVDDIPAIEKAYSRNKVVLVTSKEAYAFLEEHRVKINYAHWALSLPDKYRISSETHFEKKYDLALMGRQNPLLEKFLTKYVESHPDFVYAIKRRENGHFNYYTNKGEFVGCADGREGYFNVMRGARCGLYATPAMDNKEGSNGYNQVTPRFLELLSAGCHIIAHYPKNPDTDYFELAKFSEDVCTYEQFEKALDKGRTTPVDMSFYADYLQQHYTSVRAKQLQDIIVNI